MAEVIGVKFKDAGKVYYFDPCGAAVLLDQPVIVETARGVECGIAAIPNKEVPDAEIVKPLKKMIRIATTKDLAQIEENHRREEQAFALCQKKISEHKMDMKLVDVEYTFDNSKILFYFTADGRVDFRDLVKDLAGVFRTRIELRQIGVRDEAKMLGGLGICGRVFCCTSFLGDFQPVSIKMAKEQGLSLNPAKISGTCGRLMCCLKYEQSAYEDLNRTTPKTGTPVLSPDGPGVIVEVNLLTGMLKVRLDSGDGYRTFHKDQLKVTRDGAPQKPPRAEGQQPALPPQGQPRPERKEFPAGGGRGGEHRSRKPKADRPEQAKQPPRPPRRQPAEPPAQSKASLSDGE